MTAYHPDDSGLLAGPANSKDDEEKRRRRGGNGLLAPFMAGDQQMLAQQMAMGFGGSPQANMQYLRALYSRMPMNFNYRNLGGGGMGGGGGGKPAVGGIDPNSPPWKTSPPGRNL